MSTPTKTPIRQATEPTQDEADRFRLGWRHVWQKGEDGLMVQVRVPLSYEDVLHPQEEDFIVTSQAHVRECDYLKPVLRRATKGVAGGEVLREMRVDWGVSGLRAHLPDLSVFADVNQPWKIDLGTFPVKTLKARPVLVIEVTSPSTRSVDLDEKVLEYFKAGVPCYAIVDYRPELEDREVRVLGYRATPEGYLRIEPNERGWIWLEPVRLWLASAGERAVCYTEQGEKIEDLEELERQAQQRAEEAERQAKLARQQAEDAKHELVLLAAQMADLKARLQRMEQPTDEPPSA